MDNTTQHNTTAQEQPKENWNKPELEVLSVKENTLQAIFPGNDGNGTGSAS